MENTIETNGNKAIKPLWQFPWGYVESFFIAIALIVLGFAIEFATDGHGITPLSWPYNAYLTIIYLNIVILSFNYYRKSMFIRWISGVPASISAITIFTFLILLMGFIKQNEPGSMPILDKIGLTHVNRSWPYLLVQIYFLTVLGFVTLRRAVPFKTKNIGFLLNHSGLWIMIFAATLGSGDLKRFNMELFQERVTSQAHDAHGKTYELPIALRLVKFDIEEYNPKMILANKVSGRIIEEKNKTISIVDKGFDSEIGNWKIHVIDFIKYALNKDTGFIASGEIGASPAAYIQAKNKLTGKTAQGWICSGSNFMAAKYLDLDGNLLLAMLKPEARKFSSKIEVMTQSGKDDTVLIEVNKPVKVEGWKIYQIGYDEEMGKWSESSVVELVSDPWLPVIYAGIFLSLAGACYLFWIGKDKRPKAEIMSDEL
ncbi:MAG: cytochrome c biogenesis protein ResB [Bacteroidia bacterium]|nr:cytochrome c biogenesis protein ResB [Bacteroidia bacterium]